MPTVTDEDVLELVERFDIPVEDTASIGKLTLALKEKLEAVGVDYVSEDFLSKFEAGISLKFERMPEVGVHYELYQRPSTRVHPGGYWESIYRDVATGRFMSTVDVGSRLYP